MKRYARLPAHLVLQVAIVLDRLLPLHLIPTSILQDRLHHAESFRPRVIRWRLLYLVYPYPWLVVPQILVHFLIFHVYLS